VNIALGSIWEGLADHRWSEAQLAAIQEELNKLDFLADYEHAMRGECAFSLSMLQEEMRMGGPTDISVPGQSTSNIPRWQRMVSVLLRGFYYENLISVSQAHEAWTLPSVNLENRLVSLKIPTALQQNPRGWHPYSMFARLLMPAIDKSVVKFARAQCLLDQARVACALERYWLANQRYPDSLEALVPKLVSTLPHDIMDGKPLRYHPTGDGHFVLYSVGWNKTDEGGIAGQQKNGNLDVTTGDWPWPMAEVK